MPVTMNMEGVTIAWSMLYGKHIENWFVYSCVIKGVKIKITSSHRLTRHLVKSSFWY